MWETILSTSFLIDFVVSTFRMATPLTFAGLSCVISERCGVFNIGAEGMILAGAFAGAVGGLFTGSAWIGILFACLVGILMGLLLAILSIPLGANQIVSGIMINLLSLGLTSFLSRIIMGLSITQRLPSLEIWSLPYLADIPFLGRALFQQNPFSYISYGIVVFLYVVFYKTTWGLSIRAVGEHPRAAETAGINVDLIRYICVLLSGILRMVVYLPIYVAMAGAGSFILPATELE